MARIDIALQVALGVERLAEAHRSALRSRRGRLPERRRNTPSSLLTIRWPLSRRSSSLRERSWHFPPMRTCAKLRCGGGTQKDGQGAPAGKAAATKYNNQRSSWAAQQTTRGWMTLRDASSHLICSVDGIILAHAA